MLKHNAQSIPTQTLLFEQEVLEPVLRVQNIDLFYAQKQALFDISLDIPTRQVTAFIGASGCGKSSLLRCFNRMNDTIADCSIKGSVIFRNQDIYQSGFDAVAHRGRIGMVFQKPNPFPKSIFDNVAYGPKIQGLAGHKHELHRIVEESLEFAGLLDEVKDRMSDSAMALSGGQQQRLCIARAMAVNPEVILMDEPCSALDPIATAKIEDLIQRLTEKCTVVIVTHSMQQAARISQRTAFFHLGQLIEYDTTKTIFNNPSNNQTMNYITGRFG